jgi:hypothetical protein
MGILFPVSFAMAVMEDDIGAVAGYPLCATFASLFWPMTDVFVAGVALQTAREKYFGEKS